MEIGGDSGQEGRGRFAVARKRAGEEMLYKRRRHGLIISLVRTRLEARRLLVPVVTSGATARGGDNARPRDRVYEVGHAKSGDRDKQ